MRLYSRAGGPFLERSLKVLWAKRRDAHPAVLLEEIKVNDPTMKFNVAFKNVFGKYRTVSGKGYFVPVSVKGRARNSNY